MGEKGREGWGGGKAGKGMRVGKLTGKGKEDGLEVSSTF